MSNISTIIFDLNKTLIDYPQEKNLPNYKKILGVESSKFWITSSRYYPKYCLGEIGFNDFILNTLKDLDIEDKFGVFKELHLKDFKEIRGMKKLLSSLRKNYKLLLLAEDGEWHLETKIKKFNLRKYFEGIYCSCYEKIRKNDPLIYKTKIKKSEILFEKVAEKISS